MQCHKSDAVEGLVQESLGRIPGVESTKPLLTIAIPTYNRVGLLVPDKTNSGADLNHRFCKGIDFL